MTTASPGALPGGSGYGNPPYSGYGSPATYGLPDPAEIAGLAAAYFPEFGLPANASAQDQTGANLATAANPAGQTPNALAAAVPGAISPAVTAGRYSAGSQAPLGRYTLQEGDLLRIIDELTSPAGTGFPGAANTGSHSNAASAVSAANVPAPAYKPVVRSEDAPKGPQGSDPSNANSAVRNFQSNAPNYSLLTTYVGSKSLAAIRADFPILSEKVNGKDLVWLDNAATTQRPRQVIDRLAYYYEHENSNVHRGAHELAARSTDAYEAARDKVAKFIGAPSADNIVFTRGTTEAINLAAYACVKPFLKPGDEIILTLLEHHANIVPWQLIAEETGAVLRVAPIDDSGQIIISEYVKLFNARTRFVSAAHVSNALGTIAPVAEMIQIAHANGVRILIDGAQSISHMPVNVTALDADLFVFSGHKIFAPTGIGALYGKADVLEAARPWQGGGNMIADVTFERTLYQKAPMKFEAGTGNIADAVGLGAALDYVSGIGMANIAAWEHELLRYGTAELGKVPGLHLVGSAAQKASVLSFVLDGHGLEEVGKHLNTHGIAVRAGHHCAQPVLRRFGLEGTVRPSLAFYNTPEEIDKLVQALYALVR